MNRLDVRLASVILVALVVQQAVIMHVTIFGVHPDVLLAVTLGAAIAGGPRRGSIVGFSAGLLHDVFLTTPLGLSALGYVVAACVVGTISDGVDEPSWVSALLATLGTALAIGVYVVVANLGGDLAVSFGQAFKAVLVSALVDAALVPLLARKLRVRPVERREIAW